MRGFASRLIQRAALLCIPGLLVAHEGPATDPALALTADARLERAVEVLSHVPTGKELLARAQAFWRLSRPADVVRKLQWGTASKTDAVLTRHFNPRTGQESREREVTIFLRQGQSLDDLVLDVAHELVHATARPAWDPYDPQLTAGRYIWAAIEGEGGEVKAVASECRVAFEVHERFGAAKNASERCKSYLKTAAAGELPDLERIRKDFYRVGHWKRELLEKLGQEREMFPLLSRESPKLYSSTGNAPYPVALFQEFEEITDIACENSRKRASAESARAPAASRRSAAAFVAQRCSKRRVAVLRQD
jgi:hypothetical protein